MPTTPRRLLLSVVLLTGVLPWAVGEAAGQDVVTVGVRGGATFPVGSFDTDARGSGGGTELEGGPSFGVDLQYRSRRGSMFFLGFSQHRFGCAEAGCPGTGEYVTTGWEIGLRHGLPGGPVRPYLQAGALVSRTEDGGIGVGDPGVTGGADRPQAVSDLALGGEVGAGLEISVGSRLRLQPGARYGLTNARFSDGLLRMRYVVADLGLRVTF